jgi:FMN phosphatase YigB (HAD superfamily)
LVAFLRAQSLPGRDFLFSGRRKEFFDMQRLVVFDLDGTLVINPAFYRGVYSGTLTQLIEDLKGKEGLEVLATCRRDFGGKGELALAALGIPYAAWAERLIAAPLDLIAANPELVEAIRRLDAIKVVYTGSPVRLAERVLERIGFALGDFARVVGWQAPDPCPAKWSCSPEPFRQWMAEFQVYPENAWAVGDVWEIDLAPARLAGYTTVLIGHEKGEATHVYPTVEQFLWAHPLHQRYAR